MIYYTIFWDICCSVTKLCPTHWNPWTAACQALLPVAISKRLLLLISMTQWCHPTISYSVVPFSSCPQSFPASGSFPISQCLEKPYQARHSFHKRSLHVKVQRQHGWQMDRATITAIESYTWVPYVALALILVSIRGRPLNQQLAQLVKNLPAMQKTWVRSLGWEDPLEKGMATHSSTLTWRIPWTL